MEVSVIGKHLLHVPSHVVKEHNPEEGLVQIPFQVMVVDHAQDPQENRGIVMFAHVPFTVGSHHGVHLVVVLRLVVEGNNQDIVVAQVLLQSMVDGRVLDLSRNQGSVTLNSVLFTVDLHNGVNLVLALKLVIEDNNLDIAVAHSLPLNSVGDYALDLT